MNGRTFRLPEHLDSELRRHVESASDLAEGIKALSDFFTRNEGGKTPWNLADAYMAYFFPLNYLRVSAVLTESFREFPWTAVREIIDFGSGPGTVHFALADSGLASKPLLAVESDRRAVDLHRTGTRYLSGKVPGTFSDAVRWADKLPPRIAPGTLGIFSYSLLEEPKLEARLSEFEHLLIISPSTREQGRRLLAIRSDLSAKGFASWAPCTHQDACPLLTQSKTDWCHDRIRFEAPKWFKSLEAHLPMRNDTLTFSYWFGSRTQRPTQHGNRARVIGDTLYEKGKTRQLLCRGPEREFLAWLTRDGEAPQIPRGSLIELPETVEKKSNEIRNYRHSST